jgi:hypothetical protein
MAGVCVLAAVMAADRFDLRQESFGGALQYFLAAAR